MPASSLLKYKQKCPLEQTFLVQVHVPWPGWRKHAPLNSPNTKPGGPCGLTKASTTPIGSQSWPQKHRWANLHRAQKASMIRACMQHVCSGTLVVSLCDPMDCSPPGPCVLGILQARILECVAMPSSRGSSQPRGRTHISCFADRFFTNEPSGKPFYD